MSSPAPSQRKCDYCGTPHTRKRFCSNKCKDANHNQFNPRGFGARIDTRLEADEAHEAGMDAIEDGWDGHKNAY